MNNEFDKDIKLFRSIKEILHPTISKKNISNYKVIVAEDVLPLQVFYPKKVSGIDRVIIFIHGNGKVTECSHKYSDICKKIVKKTNHLVIALEYKEEKNNYKKMYQKIYDSVKYIYDELNKNNIKHIVLMGDSTGANIITGINYLNKGDFIIEKEILIYPTLSLEYFDNSNYLSIDKNTDFNFGVIDNLKDYYNFIVGDDSKDDLLINPLKLDSYEDIPKTLILVGNVDVLRDEAYEYFQKLDSENNKYVELEFCAHGFLKKMDSDVEDEFFEEVNNFLNR